MLFYHHLFQLHLAWISSSSPSLAPLLLVHPSYPAHGRGVSGKGWIEEQGPRKVPIREEV